MDTLALDFESTGIDPYRDRIVEIYMSRSDGWDLHTLVNPTVPIPPEATEIHGITDEAVADAPVFATLAPEIQRRTEGAVLVGFNSTRYDVPLLHVELVRAGQPGLVKNEMGLLCPPELDLYQLWVRTERRSLTDAIERFAGRKRNDAHQARADVEALPLVLPGMLSAFGLEGMPVEELCAICAPEDAVDRDGKFVRRKEDGEILFNFSDNKGKPAISEPGFLQWMLKKDFPPEAKIVARHLLRRFAEQQEQLRLQQEPAA